MWPERHTLVPYLTLPCKFTSGPAASILWPFGVRSLLQISELTLLKFFQNRTPRTLSPRRSTLRRVSLPFQYGASRRHGPAGLPQSEPQSPFPVGSCVYIRPLLCCLKTAQFFQQTTISRLQSSMSPIPFSQLSYHPEFDSCKHRISDDGSFISIQASPVLVP